MSDQKPKGFRRAFQKAKEYIDQPQKINDLLARGSEKASKSKNALVDVWEDFQCMWRMIDAWRKGKYQKVPWKTIAYALVAIIYLINPFDVIPDFIPLTGLIDDVGMITFVLRSIQKDLNDFKKWEENLTNS